MGVRPKDLIVEESLQGLFFERLQKINVKSACPLPMETIIYSSEVMGNMGESGNYFDTTKGKVREKILGVRLMEAGGLSSEECKRQLRDVGDTALCLCGYFYESLNKKIVDIGYYRELGKTAYSRLNNLVPEAYDLPGFFQELSVSFDKLTEMMGFVAATMKEQEVAEDISIFVNSQTNLKAS